MASFDYGPVLKDLGFLDTEYRERLIRFLSVVRNERGLAQLILAASVNGRYFTTLSSDSGEPAPLAFAPPQAAGDGWDDLNDEGMLRRVGRDLPPELYAVGYRELNLRPVYMPDGGAFGELIGLSYEVHETPCGEAVLRRAASTVTSFMRLAGTARHDISGNFFSDAFVRCVLQPQLAEAASRQQSVAVCAVLMDRWQVVRRRLGHDSFVHAMAAIGHAVRTSTVRDTDPVAGFAAGLGVVLPNCAGGALFDVAERIRAMVESLGLEAPGVGRVTASVGAFSTPPGADPRNINPWLLLDSAREAACAASARSGNAVKLAATPLALIAQAG